VTRGTAWIAAWLIAGAVVCHADCIPFDKAPQHVGEIVCVRGRVVKVSATHSGTHYLNFCENFRACPLTVVVFATRLADIGDVRSLEDHEVEIDGLIKLYNGQPEIVLSQSEQLHGEAASHIPPLPKKYDASEHGKFSPGSFRAKTPKRSKTKQVQQDETNPFSE
jgi:hypothetical protein